MLEAGEHILEYTRSGKDAFFASRLVQDAVIRNFEVMGEAAKNVTDATKQAWPAIPWRALARFRDVLIHGYMTLNPKEVWTAVERDLPGAVQALREAVH